MKSIFYAYLIIVLVLSGCSSGKNSFERGNYYEAVITSINRLRRNSDHKKSVETLRQAYPLAVTFYEDRAKTALASSERFKWTEVVRSYTAINTMYDEIKRSPGALAVVPNPVNYFPKLQEARQNAAEEHYAAGIVALQTETRESAKQAYGYFKTANDYVPGYKEVNDYLEAALFAATVKIVVEPIPVHAKSVGVSADFFNDKISEFIHSAPINEFVKFYTRAEAQKIKLNPDHIVQLEFDDFTVGQVYKHEKEVHLSKDSVVMGTYVSPTSTATSANSNNLQSTSLARTGTTTTGNPVVVASNQQPVNTQTVTNTNTAAAPVNNQTTAGTDGQNAALAEQQRQQRERELADKLRAEREAAEKDRIARESAEKERQAREAAEKERIAREAESERLAKEAAEKDKLARERAEAESAAREAAEKAAAERALAEKLKAEKEKAEKEKSEKERLDRERIEKSKVEKEKADRERAEKEKNNKEKYVDPSIKSEDTLNVTDPVVVCHIPPGNKANARTLKINRSALKAHLAHGDVEGGCDAEKPQEKAKPQSDEKSKPQPGNKIKAQKGSASTETSGQESSPRFGDDVVLFASRENNPAAFLRYMALAETPADTNKVYGTVKAVLYHYTKTTTSKGIVSFRIIDAKTGALLSVQKMPGEFVWKSEWATFNGDERALSPEQIQLTRQKELPAPAPQELFIEFTRPIYDQITTKLKEFYKGY